MLDKGVPFTAFSLIFSSFTGNSDSDSPWQVSDSLIPDELVELRVDSNILGLHHLGDELFDFGECSGSLSFELSPVCEFVDVDGGVDGGFAKSLSLLFFAHSHSNIK